MPADLTHPVRRRPAPGPGQPGHPPGRRSRLVRVGLGLVTVGVLACGVGVALSPPAPVPQELRPPVAGPPVAGAAVAAPPVAAAVRATGVDIPALDVHSALVPLGVDAAGVLVPPPSPSVAGWFTGSSAPGDPGPAVIAGHVDSRTGPGVFYRLKDLAPGDEVTVGRSDGTVARYRVTVVTVVAKKAFPTDTVYGPTPGPELRLITCGGEFDRSIGHYLRNVVVSAVLVG